MPGQLRSRSGADRRGTSACTRCCCPTSRRRGRDRTCPSPSTSDPRSACHLLGNPCHPCRRRSRRRRPRWSSHRSSRRPAGRTRRGKPRSSVRARRPAPRRARRRRRPAARTPSRGRRRTRGTSRRCTSGRARSPPWPCTDGPSARSPRGRTARRPPNRRRRTCVSERIRTVGRLRTRRSAQRARSRRPGSRRPRPTSPSWA